MAKLLRILSGLPLWLMHALGAALGWLSWWASPSYRARFRAQVAQAGLASAAARPAVAEAGKMIAELPWLWLRPVAQMLGSRVSWDGVEVIDQALAAKRGIVFLTPHLGCFEVTAQAFAEHFAPDHGPITVLFRPARKAWMREIVDGSRARPGVATAPATLAGVRQMIRALRKGGAIGLLPDQVPPEGMGVWAPFFGRPAYTMTLAARLIQQTGAVPVLAWGERLPFGRGFVVHVRPGPQIEAESTPESAAATINQAMEHLILDAPAQYLWGYHRFKQPRGQAVEPSEA
nr:lysophospholipid acyltransferase family protein [uncultured Roseateles sp.]